MNSSMKLSVAKRRMSGRRSRARSLSVMACTKPGHNGAGATHWTCGSIIEAASPDVARARRVRSANDTRGLQRGGGDDRACECGGAGATGDRSSRQCDRTGIDGELPGGVDGDAAGLERDRVAVTIL